MLHVHYLSHMYMCIVCVFSCITSVLNGDSVTCSCLYNECSSRLSCHFDTDNGMLTWCQKW